jgi:hypothetical protein
MHTHTHTFLNIWIGYQVNEYAKQLMRKTRDHFYL